MLAILVVALAVRLGHFATVVRKPWLDFSLLFDQSDMYAFWQCLELEESAI